MKMISVLLGSKLLERCSIYLFLFEVEMNYIIYTVYARWKSQYNTPQILFDHLAYYSLNAENYLQIHGNNMMNLYLICNYNCLIQPTQKGVVFLHGLFFDNNKH